MKLSNLKKINNVIDCSKISKDNMYLKYILDDTHDNDDLTKPPHYRVNPVIN